MFLKDMYTLLYLKRGANKDLPGNSAQCCVAAWVGGDLEESTCVGMAEYLKLSQHC